MPPCIQHRWLNEPLQKANSNSGRQRMQLLLFSHWTVMDSTHPTHRQSGWVLFPFRAHPMYNWHHCVFGRQSLSRHTGPPSAATDTFQTRSVLAVSADAARKARVCQQHSQKQPCFTQRLAPKGRERPGALLTTLHQLFPLP